MTDFPKLVVDGITTIPDRPGLGIAVDPEKIRKYETHVLTVE